MAKKNTYNKATQDAVIDMTLWLQANGPVEGKSWAEIARRIKKARGWAPHYKLIHKCYERLGFEGPSAPQKRTTVSMMATLARCVLAMGDLTSINADDRAALIEMVEQDGGAE